MNLNIVVAAGLAGLLTAPAVAQQAAAEPEKKPATAEQCRSIFNAEKRPSWLLNEDEFKLPTSLSSDYEPASETEGEDEEPSGLFSDRKSEKPWTLKGGVVKWTDGERTGKVDLFYRVKAAEGGWGSVGVSPGLGYTRRKSHDGESYESYDRVHGHELGYHDNGLRQVWSHGYKGVEEKSQYFELLRADYTTPEVGPLKFYAGVGAGVMRRKSELESSGGQTIRRGGSPNEHPVNADEYREGPSYYGSDRKTRPFWTAFAGCQLDGKKAFGIPCDVVVECEKIFAPGEDGKFVPTVGFKFDF